MNHLSGELYEISNISVLELLDVHNNDLTGGDFNIGMGASTDLLHNSATPRSRSRAQQMLATLTAEHRHRYAQLWRLLIPQLRSEQGWGLRIGVGTVR
ncbi:hypothetical protein LIER_29271 [Lithospermum erythrorhizon]|uniref:Uncharacterized protein n=1 Tax=Lithospermum erythrorhizon TaxID=34254 RepID=A0AAV3RJL4_LITER